VLMQCLFNNALIRDAIFNMNIGEDAKLWGQWGPINSVIQSLQEAFGYMLLSQKRVYSLNAFTSKYQASAFAYVYSLVVIKHS
jgi:hypothetical protein